MLIENIDGGSLRELCIMTRELFSSDAVTYDVETIRYIVDPLANQNFAY
jgi:hypothetical protein